MATNESIGNIGNIRPVRIVDEMRSSYLDYAMSVIVARALPDVRDGLKPVHRRILFAMDDLNLGPNTAYKKCARIVGEVLGKYHPHGDAPVYDALVRMAQDFSMRYPLVDGQGNFGSIDDDPPAAMRYTEARLAAIAQELLIDIDKETVDFTPNFDDSLKEPVVLPARLPNLLVNGSSGIAVGMATNIPPHNLNEVCNATAHLIDNPDATVEDLMKFVKGPDFPTAGIIMGREGIIQAYASGRGRVIVRAQAAIEEMAKGGKKQIIVTELPFQVNKAALVEKIADLVKDKKVEGISELRDESDRQGMRVVIELRKDAFPEQVLNNLYKHTVMQSAFHMNMLALVDGAPKSLSLKNILQHYIDFRHHVIVRRSEFELKKARERDHILEGLLKALEQLDAVIKTIRESESADQAKQRLIQGFALDDIQAQAILDMQLRRLALLESQKIRDEHDELIKKIASFEDLLAHQEKIFGLIKDDLKELQKTYGDKRRTEISREELGEFNVEDLIPHQEMVVTISQRGYIKRMPRDTYRVQRRGGRGKISMVPREADGIREADAVQHLLVADTHDLLLFFTNKGKVTPLKCYQVPSESSRTAKGLPVVNLLSGFEPNEVVNTVIAVPTLDMDGSVIMATRAGTIKKVDLRQFANVRSNGIRAINLKGKDELVSVRIPHDEMDVIMVTRKGQSIRFPSTDVRSMGRTAAGVRGIRLAPGDHVIAMDVITADSYLLTVTSKGMGKLTPLKSYRIQGRGGQGVRTFKILPKTGEVVAARVVDQSQKLMIVSRKGNLEHTDIDTIRVASRITEGVIVMRIDEGDAVASIAVIDAKIEEEEPEETNGKPKGKANGEATSGAKPTKATITRLPTAGKGKPGKPMKG